MIIYRQNLHLFFILKRFSVCDFLYKAVNVLYFMGILFFLTCTMASHALAEKNIKNNSINTDKKNLYIIALVYHKNFNLNFKTKQKVINGCQRIDNASGRSQSSTVLSCSQHITLLRSKNKIMAWVQAWKKSGHINLDVPGYGAHPIKVDITSIKPASLTGVFLHKKNTLKKGQVTGIYRRYVSVVKTYQLKNVNTGVVSIVHATPNHPFYVLNRKKFVALDNITPEDEMLTSTGNKVQMQCPPGCLSHCGKIWHKGIPTPVYNLEIYHNHTYFTGADRVLVHNCTVRMKKGDMVYGFSDNIDKFESLKASGFNRKEQTIAGIIAPKSGYGDSMLSKHLASGDAGLKCREAGAMDMTIADGKKVYFLIDRRMGLDDMSSYDNIKKTYHSVDFWKFPSGEYTREELIYAMLKLRRKDYGANAANLIFLDIDNNFSEIKHSVLLDKFFPRYKEAHIVRYLTKFERSNSYMHRTLKTQE